MSSSVFLFGNGYHNGVSHSLQNERHNGNWTAQAKAQKISWLDIIVLHINGHDIQAIPLLMRAGDEFVEECAQDFVGQTIDDLYHSFEQLGIGEGSSDRVSHKAYENDNLALPLKIACRLESYIRQHYPANPAQAMQFALQACFLLPSSVQDEVWQSLRGRIAINHGDLQEPLDRVLNSLLFFKKIEFSALQRLLATFGLLSEAPQIVGKEHLALGTSANCRYLLPCSLLDPVRVASSMNAQASSEYDQELKELYRLFPPCTRTLTKQPLTEAYGALKQDQKKFALASADLMNHSHPVISSLGFRLLFLEVQLKNGLVIIDPRKLLMTFPRLFPLFNQNSQADDSFAAFIHSLQAVLSCKSYTELLVGFKARVEANEGYHLAYLKSITASVDFSKNEVLKATACYVWQTYFPTACFEWVALGEKIVESISPIELSHVVDTLKKLIQKRWLPTENAVRLLTKLAPKCGDEKTQKLLVELLVPFLEKPSVNLYDVSCVQLCLPHLLTSIESASPEDHVRALRALLQLSALQWDVQLLSQCILKVLVKLLDSDFYAAVSLWRRGQEVCGWRAMDEDAPDLPLLVLFAQNLGARSDVDIFSYLDTFVEWLDVLEEKAPHLLSGEENFCLCRRAHELLFFKTAIANETPAYWKHFIATKACPPEYRTALLIELLDIALRRQFVDEAKEWVALLVKGTCTDETHEVYQAHLERAIHACVAIGAFDEALQLMLWSPCLLEGKERITLLASLYEWLDEPLGWMTFVSRQPSLLTNSAFLSTTRDFALVALHRVLLDFTTDWRPQVYTLLNAYRVCAIEIWHPLLTHTRTKEQSLEFIKQLQTIFTPADVFLDNGKQACLFWTDVFKLFKQHCPETSESWLSKIVPSRAIFTEASKEQITTCLISYSLCLLAKAIHKSTDKIYGVIFLQSILLLEEQMGELPLNSDTTRELSAGFVRLAASSSSLKIIERACFHFGRLLRAKDKRRCEIVASSIPLLLKRYTGDTNGTLTTCIGALGQIEAFGLDYLACAEALVLNQHVSEASMFFVMALQRMPTTAKTFQKAAADSPRLLNIIVTNFLHNAVSPDSFELLSALFQQQAKVFVDRKQLHLLRVLVFKAWMRKKMVPCFIESDEVKRLKKIALACSFYLELLKVHPNDLPLDLEALNAVLMTSSQLAIQAHPVPQFSYTCFILELHDGLNKCMGDEGKSKTSTDALAPLELLVQNMLNLSKMLQREQTNSTLAFDCYQWATKWLEEFAGCKQGALQPKLALIRQCAFELIPMVNGYTLSHHLARIARMLKAVSHNSESSVRSDLFSKLYLLCYSNLPHPTCYSNFPPGLPQEMNRKASLIIEVVEELVKTRRSEAILYALEILISKRSVIASLPPSKLLDLFRLFYNLTQQENLKLEVLTQIFTLCGRVIGGNCQATFLGWSFLEQSRDARRYLSQYISSVSGFCEKMIVRHNPPAPEIIALLNVALNTVQQAHEQQIYLDDEQGWILLLRELFTPSMRIPSKEILQSAFAIVQGLIMHQSHVLELEEGRLDLILSWLNTSLMLPAKDTVILGMILAIAERALAQLDHERHGDLILRIREAIAMSSTLTPAIGQ